MLWCWDCDNWREKFNPVGNIFHDTVLAIDFVGISVIKVLIDDLNALAKSFDLVLIGGVLIVIVTVVAFFAVFVTSVVVSLIDVVSLSEVTQQHNILLVVTLEIRHPNIVRPFSRIRY